MLTKKCTKEVFVIAKVKTMVFFLNHEEKKFNMIRLKKRNIKQINAKQIYLYKFMHI